MNTTQATATETATHIHPWEKAGLGKAPFRWMGVSRKVGPVRIIDKDGLEWQIGAPGQPMGTCDFCGQGIAECHAIRSADGKDFTVGCDCVRKVYVKGERVLTQVEKASRDLRNEKARKRCAAKADESKAELAALMADESLRAKLAAKPSAYAWKAAQGGTALDDAEFLAGGCGHTGRVKLIKSLKSV
jgi:hypothetical protein